METFLWVEEYRPKDVVSCVLPKELKDTFSEFVNQGYVPNLILSGGHGEGFCIGNILKYAQRYGKKNGKDKRDLLKVIHYGIIALHVNDMENGE